MALMSLNQKILCCGPLGNNVVILFEMATRKAVIFDPSFEPEQILSFVEDTTLMVEKILFTHGHFDHFAGLNYLLANITPVPVIGLHIADLDLWRRGGGSVEFRMQMDRPADPDFFLYDSQVIELGGEKIQVRHTPGHSPGSVIFYIESLKTAVVGDLIFHQGVGRTDLDGGSYAALQESIQQQVFTLPSETTLIPGHGPFTTVETEMRLNPYVGSASQFL